MTKNTVDPIQTGKEIAIIGMAGKFPGAKNIKTFWTNLRDGIESITFYSDNELEENGVTPEMLSQPGYVKAKGALEEKEFFDSAFFGYTPIEAEIMDPQIRVFHECVWEALEDAGYIPDQYNRLIGLYAGASSSTYWEALSFFSGKSNELGGFSSALLSDKDHINARVSYNLNLKGPVFSLHTACSTSLVAIHLASRALLTGECKIALGGGININTSPFQGYLFQEGMIFSPDGHCRTFDAKAKGTISGEGVGIVVLKRLKNAISDGDHIYAVIKGSAINNDGKRKVGYTAPSVEAQAEVIQTAQRIAQVAPETISYIEAHGTGTPLGDPIEIEALTLAFETEKRNFCAIGSVKTNIGHLDVAAGIAGFIKTVLAIKHKTIPPSLHFEKPNPIFNITNTPFYINNESRKWGNENQPLRAGVNAFGIGGTNAHVVLEEAPPLEPSSKGRESSILLFSARTEPALDRLTENFVRYLKHHPGINLSDAAYTLQVGRKVLKHRRLLVCSDVDDAITTLTTTGARRVRNFSHPSPEDNPQTIFMFSGLGAQYVKMGYDLYRKEPEFRKTMDDCFRILKTLGIPSIKEILYPDDTSQSLPGIEVINHPEIAQPVMFIFEYALAKLLIGWGITPQAMIGYSFGEYAAACIAEVFSPEDALKLIVQRGELINQTPEGLMLSVPLPFKEITDLLTDEISVAIDNGESCVLAGSMDTMIQLEKQLIQKRILGMRLPAVRAIHSKMVEPILGIFEEIISHIPLNKPQIPFISNVTGNYITHEQAVSTSYWAEHLRATVQFSAGVRELCKEKKSIFIEVGPGNDLCSLVSRHFSESSIHSAVNLIRARAQEITDTDYILNKIGQLWLYGEKINWQAFYSTEKRHRIPLPTYPFEGNRYWIDGSLLNMSEKLSQGVLGGEKKDIGNWFYIPTWKRTCFINSNRNHPVETTETENWLVFTNRHPLSIKLVEHLKEMGQDVITIEPALEFNQLKERAYQINPQNRIDYENILTKIKQSQNFPTKIIHAWGISEKKTEEANSGISKIESVNESQALGFYSLLYLLQAIGKQNLTEKTQLTVVTDNIQSVTGEENLCPEKSTLLGLIKVIPQEYPHIHCRSIDLNFSGSTQSKEKEWIEQILNEFSAEPGETIIAYRGNSRWIQIFQQTELIETAKQVPVLKEKGIYLITGGMGDIGLVMAEYLIKNLNAKLVLTGRSLFPPRVQWETWIKEHSGENAISRKIKKLMELDESGENVLFFNVDISDNQGMQRVITQVENQWGIINGVIHLAGIIKGSSINFIGKLSQSDCQQQFQPKINGLLVLADLFHGKELDFFWVMSSIASILGGVGFAVYAAANIFMDTFVQKYTSSNRWKWISVNWDRDIPEEIIAGLTRILAMEKGNQIIFSSGGNLHDRLDRWVKPKSIADKDQADNKKIQKPKSFQSRPFLSAPYIAPYNHYQENIVVIWENFFGYDQVGIQDNFFELGGDSLMAITLISKIHKQYGVAVPLGDFFSKPTIEDLTEYIKNAKITGFLSIKPVEKKEYHSLSSAQKRIYILQQMELKNVGYNEYHVVSLQGNLDTAKLKLTFRKLIERHEVLRTSIIMVNDEAVQKIHDKVEFELEFHDEAVEDAIDTFMRPFDLSKPPFVRVGLLKQEESKHVLMIDMHHIITDGLSFGIFIKDLMGIYGEQVLPGLKLHYKDYSEWQHTKEQQTSISNQEDYWLKEFSSDIPLLDLPTDYPRPAVQSFEGSSLVFQLEPQETQKLKEFGAMEEATLFMILTTIFNIFLTKLSGQEDIVIGSPIAGRRHVELQNIMGFFVNTLALRNKPAGQQTVIDFLKEVKRNALKSFENQDYPFEELVERVAVDRDLCRNPLFDVMLLLQNVNIPKVEIPGLTLSPYEHKSQIAKFDLELSAFETEGKILFSIQYCTKLFNQLTIERFISYFKKIIATILSDPAVKIENIEILSEEEKNRLLVEFNNTATSYPCDQTIHELFEKQSAKTPGSIAVAFEDQALTYEGLNEKAGQLAEYLLQEMKIRSEEPVAVLMDRSLNIVTAILGILKAGGAYIPIDSTLPEIRINYMINDAQIGVVISEKKNIKTLNRLQWECDSFHTFLCMDSNSIYEEDEAEINELMDEGMWNYIGESDDEIEAGGWISSYTGEPFSKEEMQEYSDNVFNKLMPLLNKNMKVLEIGCASGITLFRIAPFVQFYFGTDLSRIIIEKNKAQVKIAGYKNISLECLPAHKIDRITVENFDLIIINSVIQYFHGHNYLRKIIVKSIDKLAENGYLFLGDIMDQELKGKLIRKTKEFRRNNNHKNYRTKTTWDAELFISRGFLEDLALQIPAIQSIEFSNKKYTLENELTEFRYDALITIDKKREKTDKAPKPLKRQQDLKILNMLNSQNEKVKRKVHSQGLAYATYTSGTTGLPKGIMIQHQSVINFIKGMTDVIPFNENDRILSLTTISFDIFGLETLLPLTKGSEVVIGNIEEQLDQQTIIRTLRKKQISIFQLTPSRLQLLLSGDISRTHVKGIKYLIVGGEAFPELLLEEAKQLFFGEIYNVYGPTETTIWSTLKNITGVKELNIGHPIANTQIYILDKNKKILPVKIAGELCIGGDGLARGYLNNPQLTSEKFIDFKANRNKHVPSHIEHIPGEGIKLLNTKNDKEQHSIHSPIPIFPYTPIYLTGDLARWLPDGNIEFFGRIDHQVKIRGFRIELGEIEKRLITHEDIKEAVVICRTGKNEEKYLCSYIVTDDDLHPADLREYLLKNLPDYMIPSHFLRIDKIPLTKSGKINRKALPAPEKKFSRSNASPRNRLEEKLVRIWSEVIGIEAEQIGTDSNFFYLGGHSLKATILISRIHKELNVKIPLSEMFKDPTIESMAKFLSVTDKHTFAAIPPAEKKEYYILSSAQKRMYIAHQMEVGSMSYNLPYIIRLNGKLDSSCLQEACQKLVQRHEGFRTSFSMLEEKPVQVISANVPFEMADYEAAIDKIPGLVKRFIRPFDLSQAPLLRVELVKIGELDYILMVDMFHIIADAISAEIFLYDLITLYQNDNLPPLRIQYKDYSEWQYRLTSSKVLKKQETFWLNTFKDEIPILNIPTDFPRPSIRSTEGNILYFELDRELTEKTRHLIAETETTLYMVLLAVFNILLAKYSNQDEIIVGTPASGRNHADLLNIIGTFANMLAMKNHPSEEKSVCVFLQEIKENALKAYENQDYQFEELIAKLGVQMDPGRRPLFDVVLNMLKQGEEESSKLRDFRDLTISPHEFDYNLSKYDLLLRVTEETDRINMSLEYTTALFRKNTIETMITHYIEILNRVVENREVKIKDISTTSKFKMIENVTDEEDVEFNF